MANIQQRRAKDGRVRVQVRLRGFPAQSASFARRADARIWAQRTEAAIREGRYFPTSESKRHTVADLVDRYVEMQERHAPRSLPKQSQTLNWWKEHIGDYALASVTPALIGEKRDLLLRENISRSDTARRRRPSTANRYLASLSAAFTKAVREWHWLNENPLRRVSKEQEPQGRVRYLSEPERDALLKACQASRLPDTKNRDRRSIPLVPQVAAPLEKHAKVRRLDTDRVFPQPGLDKPLEIDHWFDMALAAAEISDFRFHDLRHTAASYLAMSGATPPEIAAVLGHRTLQMVKRWAHLSDAHTGAVVERVTRKFFGDSAA